MTDYFPIPGVSPGQLAIVNRPRGGDWLPIEIENWKRRGITTMVTHLTPDEDVMLDLTNEADETVRAGLHPISYPINDRGIPADPRDYIAFILQIAERILKGETVAVHCRQSIGRAPLTAIAVLKSLGWNTEKAVDAVSLARGRPVPETLEQRRWLDSLRFPEPAVAS